MISSSALLHRSRDTEWSWNICPHVSHSATRVRRESRDDDSSLTLRRSDHAPLVSSRAHSGFRLRVTPFLQVSLPPLLLPSVAGASTRAREAASEPAASPPSHFGADYTRCLLCSAVRNTALLFRVATKLSSY